MRYVREEHYAHVYAVALLAHFQEQSALPPIIRAFYLPDELMDFLWEDMVTETLPALLVQTGNGQLDTIKDLILDKNAPEYVRGAAVDSLTYAVAKDIAERDEVITFLAGLFTGSEAEDDSDFWNSVACAISDLHPEGAMPVLRQAVAEGLVTPDYVGLEDFERNLTRDQEEVLAELRFMVEHRVPQDVHDYLSWLADFQEHPPLLPPHVNFANKAQQKKKKTNRAKAKLAKKARKKNRR